MSHTITDRDAITALGRAIDARGISADPMSLLLLAHAARDLDVPAILIEVMVDEHEVEVARIRAFALVSCRVSVQLDGSGVPTVDDLEAASSAEPAALVGCLPVC